MREKRKDGRSREVSALTLLEWVSVCQTLRKILECYCFLIALPRMLSICIFLSIKDHKLPCWIFHLISPLRWEELTLSGAYISRSQGVKRRNKEKQRKKEGREKWVRGLLPVRLSQLSVLKKKKKSCVRRPAWKNCWMERLENSL